jgi:catechol 2,3-dioxygenase-like lactoylglutathione lyase family enzyme
VGHVGLSVPDLDAATRWYADALGLRLAAEPACLRADASALGRQVADVLGPDISVRQAHMLARGGVALELFEFRGAPRWPLGLFHVCFVDPDIEAAVARVRATGGRARSGRWPIGGSGPGTMCYCADPFGNVVELATHDGSAAVRRGSW